MGFIQGHTKQRVLSPKTALSTHYFLYFGIMGIFLPFFNLFCHHIGLTGLQIGAVNAARTIVMVLFAVAWGALADRLALRRPIFITASCLSAASWSLFLFADTFAAIFVVTLVYAAFFGPIIPFLEAFTMEALSGKGENPNRYGRIRAWGSFSFIAVVLAMGKTLDIFSSRIVIPFILVGSVVMALSSFAIPSSLSPRKRSTPADFKSLLTPRVLLFLLAGFLMLASHGTYYGFFSIHLEELGYPPSFTALTWGMATLAEVGVMLWAAPLFKKLSTEKSLVISFVVASLRWLILYFFTNRWVILGSQLLHAVTYALFHIACIVHMDRLSTPANRTLSQVINNAISYGLGLMAGFFISGLFYQKMGGSLFLVSALISLMGAFVMARALVSPP